MFIVFNTKEAAFKAVEKCWVKYLKIEVSPERKAGNGQEYTGLTGLTDEQIKELKLYGQNHLGIDEKQKGITTGYQVYVKAHNQEKWFFAKPPDILLELLSGYTVKTPQQMKDEGYYPPDIL